MASLCGLYVLFVSFFAAYGQLNIQSWMQCPAEMRERWSYRGLNGPPFWGMRDPECNGRQQSPIDIKRKDAIKDENLAKLILNNYDKPITEGTIENNGHTIEITPKDGINRTISVNGDDYVLRQFHFHWGDNSNKGSEHTLEGKQYAMELHFVHMNANNQIAVVGVIYKEQDDDNGELQNFVGQFDEVRYKGDETELKSNINLNNLLPANPTSYFRYQGSLTTPPCTQGVTWSVVPDLMPVGNTQMEKFRNLYAVTKEDADKPENTNCKLVNNYRPVQPLNGRKVYLSQ